MQTVLVTGATGFVGARLVERLETQGRAVRRGTRDVDSAQQKHGGSNWVRLDVDRKETLPDALEGANAAFYLVHEMGDGPGYAEREKQAAIAFADAAARARVQRIIYLGGVAPKERPSRHLRSRIATGEALRSGSVPVFELRASMIIGQGSTSWQIVRDLAARLPAMLLPKWLETRTEPIGIDDVIDALVASLDLPLEKAGVYDVPGPEVMSAREILFRVARLRGTRPVAVSVPVLSPRLSSYWLKFVTGADYAVARELVEGLSSDLVSHGDSFWGLVPGHARVPFDEAVRRAMGDERHLPLTQHWFEGLVAKISRSPTS